MVDLSQKVKDNNSPIQNGVLSASRGGFLYGYADKLLLFD